MLKFEVFTKFLFRLLASLKTSNLPTSEISKDNYPKNTH